MIERAIVDLTSRRSQAFCSLCMSLFVLVPSATVAQHAGLTAMDLFRKHYFGRSILSVVKNVKTPTLIMTGEQNFRTPLMESEQYYRALKLLGVESVLVRVPEGSHGLWARPSQSAAKLTTAIGWFEKHRVR